MNIDITQLNEFYKRLDDKKRELARAFQKDKRTVGYFNGHYRKDERGEFKMDYFPIPEITLPGLCDIEINPNDITISTKLSRDTALSYDFNNLSDYRFEAFGVDDYLSDYYTPGNTIDELIENIQKSNDAEIGFAFIFTHDLDADTLYKFTDFLRSEGFFY